MIIARSDYPVDESIREKIALFCDVKKDSVIPLVTTDVLYEIPLILENIGAAEILLERLQLKPKHEPDWKEWNWLISQTKRQKPVINIGLVGKYVELHDAYISVREALNHAALYQDVEINIDWIASTDLEKGKELEKLKRADGIIVPGGFGSRGVEGKIIAAQFARKNKIPFLGLCLGMQAMIIEFAREILEDDGANSTEFDQLTNNPVIDLMPNQHNIVNMGATMRLGLYPCKLISGSKVALLYEKPLVQERHRHRYEVNNKYRAMLEENGILISGISPDNRLVEVVEIKDHPYMIGCQFHPEFTSRPNEPHPLFEGFISSVINRKSNNQ
jgi:CTP synthase